MKFTSRKLTLLMSFLMLTACASEPKQSTKQSVVSCNYAQNLEAMNDMPEPSGDSAVEYAEDLQSWGLESIFINKRNIALRDYTKECLQNIE